MDTLFFRERVCTYHCPFAVFFKNYLRMTTSFLDYYKMILDKVSFDSNLFTKEYQKATRNLHTHEIGDLNSWLRSKGLQTILPDQVKRVHQGNDL